MFYSPEAIEYSKNPIKCNFCGKELTYKQYRVMLHDRQQRQKPIAKDVFCSVKCCGKSRKKDAPNPNNWQQCATCEIFKLEEDFEYVLISKKYRKQCRKCVFTHRQKRKSHYQNARKSRIKSRFKLTEDQYDNFYNKYQGKCYICQTEDAFCLDHCHNSNIIRGALCNGCNSAIGFLKDSPELLRKAAEYLEEFYENLRKHALS